MPPPPPGIPGALIKDPPTEKLDLVESVAPSQPGSWITYTVTLTQAPDGDAILTATMDASAVTQAVVRRAGTGDAGASQANVTFTASDWAAGIRSLSFEAAALGDGVVEGVHYARIEHQVTVGGLAASDAPAKLDLTIADADATSAGVNLGATMLRVDEGAERTLAISLRARPADDVQLTVAVPQASLGTLSLSGTDVNGARQADVTSIILKFTPSTFDVAQDVTVRAALDEIANGIQSKALVVTCSSLVPPYDELEPVRVGVEVVDQSSTGVSIGAVDTVEVREGDGSGFTLQTSLRTRPLATVELTARERPIDNATRLQIVPDTLTFAPSAWNSAKLLQLFATDDDVAQGDTVVRILLETSSLDGGYDGMVEPVDVRVLDNDVVGWSWAYTSLPAGVSPAASVNARDQQVPQDALATSDHALHVGEGGRVSYTISPLSRPFHDVNVDAGVGGVEALPAWIPGGVYYPVLFALGDASVPVTSASFSSERIASERLTFIAPDDDVCSGVGQASKHEVTIQHSVASDDASYAATRLSSITVQVLDDDIPYLCVGTDDPAAPCGGAGGEGERGPVVTVYEGPSPAPQPLRLRLSTRPQVPTVRVRVTAIGSDIRVEVPGGGDTVSFTQENFASGVDVSVSPIDDDLEERVHIASISFALVETGDPCYAPSLAIPTVRVRIIDDELADPITETVNLSSGGDISTDFGLTVRFPPNARPGGGTETLTVRQMSVRQMVSPPPASIFDAQLTAMLTLTSAGGSDVSDDAFSNPVALRIPVAPSGSYDSVAVVTTSSDVEGATWSYVPDTTIDMSSGSPTIVALVSHFSIFSVVSVKPSLAVLPLGRTRGDGSSAPISTSVVFTEGSEDASLLFPSLSLRGVQGAAPSTSPTVCAAKVSFTSGYQREEDRLELVGTADSDTIAATFDVANGELTLHAPGSDAGSAGGRGCAAAASAAAYERVLRTVGYRNTNGDDPVSNVARSVTVTTIEPYATLAQPVFPSGTARGAEDADLGDGGTKPPGLGGKPDLGGKPGPGGPGGLPGLGSGDAGTSANSVGIRVNAVNDPPVIVMSISELVYAEGSPAVPLDAGIAISDADDATIARAEMQIVPPSKSDLVLYDSEDAPNAKGKIRVSQIESDELSEDGIPITYWEFAGAASVEVYVEAMRALKYINNGPKIEHASKLVLVYVEDSSGGTGGAERAMAVVEQNDPPRASDGKLRVREDGDSDPGSSVMKAFDPENQVLTFRVVCPGSKGNVRIVDSASGAFVYTPHPNLGLRGGEVGYDSFVFIAADSDGADSNFAVFSITIEGVDEPPVAEDIYITAFDGVEKVFALPVSDPDGNDDIVAIYITQRPSLDNNAARLAGQYQTEQSLLGGSNPATYFIPKNSPSALRLGQDSFKFRAQDRTGALSEEATAHVTLILQRDYSNVPPRAPTPQILHAFEDTRAFFALEATDDDTTDLAFLYIQGSRLEKGRVACALPNETSVVSLITEDTGAQLCAVDDPDSLGKSGLISYEPLRHRSGDDVFWVVAKDNGDLKSDGAQVVVRIAPVNDPPIAACAPASELGFDAGSQSVGAPVRNDGAFARRMRAGDVDEALDVLVDVPSDLEVDSDAYAAHQTAAAELRTFWGESGGASGGLRGERSFGILCDDDATTSTSRNRTAPSEPLVESEGRDRPRGFVLPGSTPLVDLYSQQPTRLAVLAFDADELGNLTYSIAAYPTLGVLQWHVADDDAASSDGSSALGLNRTAPPSAHTLRVLERPQGRPAELSLYTLKGRRGADTFAWRAVDTNGTASALVSVAINVACGPGSVVDASDPSKCRPCPPGYRTLPDALDQTKCIPCAKGEFNDAYGATECQKCAAGSFASQSASTKCTACPHANQTSEAGSTSPVECVCVEGFYQTWALDTAHPRLPGEPYEGTGEDGFAHPLGYTAPGECYACDALTTVCDEKGQILPKPRSRMYFVNPFDGGDVATCEPEDSCIAHTDVQDVLEGKCARGYK